MAKPRTKRARRKRLPLEGIILGVDLDGVCSDFYARMREVAAEWLEVELDTLPTEVTYGLPEWGFSTPQQYESLHRWAVSARDLFRSSLVIRGARKYLRLLSDEGVRIRIITHRLFIEYFHNAAVSQTIDWLDYHGIPYWDLCFMKAKEQVGADIYIDDAPGNIRSLRDADLYAICFANSTNVDVPAPRAASWAEVYQLVHERAKVIKKQRSDARKKKGRGKRKGRRSSSG
jgi:5'(3')-deoxyribonucleotidase